MDYRWQFQILRDCNHFWTHYFLFAKILWSSCKFSHYHFSKPGLFSSHLELHFMFLSYTFWSSFKVNCSRLNGFIGMNDRIKQYILNKLSVEDIEYFNDLLHSCKDENSYKNVTREEQELRVQPTELRSNPVYYRLYYVHLNTIFASLIPLVSLLYLNIATVKALKKMAEVRQEKDWFVSRLFYLLFPGASQGYRGRWILTER